MGVGELESWEGNRSRGRGIALLGVVAHLASGLVFWMGAKAAAAAAAAVSAGRPLGKCIKNHPSSRIKL